MQQPSARVRAEELWRELSEAFSAYPSGVEPVPEPIRGTAFFPGGLGLHLDGCVDPESLSTEIMVVGQDFNSVATYKQVKKNGSEFESSRTWKNMQSVFPELGLAFRECFFTNFYMGLRATGPEMGRFPGSRDPDFVQHCVEFFRRQMDVMRPRVIVTLGKFPMQAVWRECFGLEAPKNLNECVDVWTEVSAAHGGVALVALTQPALYFANVGKRRFQGLEGRDAEEAMVQAALASTRGIAPDH